MIKFKKFLTNMLAQDPHKAQRRELPEVVNDYLSISEKYRSTMKTVDGKTAKDLLLESLHDIDSALEKMNEKYEQEGLNKLNVTSKYLKASL